MAIIGDPIYISASNIDTSGATITTGTILSGYKGINSSGTLITGTIPSKSAQTYTPGTSSQTISSGRYLSGTQTISGDANLIAANIKSGVSIFGVTGTLASSSYTQIYSGTQTVNTSSTSATSVTTISLGSSYYTSDKIIYVKIRDKAGPRNNYFTGTDAFFFNPYKKNNVTTNAQKVIFTTRKQNNGLYETYAQTGTNGYGVYAYSLNSSGQLAIYRRYNSTYSLTINGTYDIKVYTLDYAPSQGNPYNYSSFT